MKTESSNRHANPLEAIRSEFETIPDTTDIGMLSIKSANRTLEDAARRPDPEQLYLELWYEGEVCCLFADSNLGKSIFAVQMADTITSILKFYIIFAIKVIRRTVSFGTVC